MIDTTVDTPINDEVRFTPILAIAILLRKKGKHRAADPLIYDRRQKTSIPKRKKYKPLYIPAAACFQNRKRHEDSGPRKQHHKCDLDACIGGCFFHKHAIQRIREHRNNQEQVSCRRKAGGDTRRKYRRQHTGQGDDNTGHLYPSRLFMQDQRYHRNTCQKSTAFRCGRKPDANGFSDEINHRAEQSYQKERLQTLSARMDFDDSRHRQYHDNSRRNEISPSKQRQGTDMFSDVFCKKITEAKQHLA